MADDEAEPGPEPDPEPEGRRRPERRADTEKAIGLEVARLFGLSPQTLAAPRARRPEPEAPAEPAAPTEPAAATEPEAPTDLAGEG
ncbi:MAG TPA: hypothetical protein VKX24_12445 [Acidimicrobiia bacterium]|nr:hypothetical protein [Acidimicrobiia bacterium]HZQ80003.1 hypothetical protein [Acidimicrobiia bacterium]